jgi:hypothetical protein
LARRLPRRLLVSALVLIAACSDKRLIRPEAPAKPVPGSAVEPPRPPPLELPDAAAAGTPAVPTMELDCAAAARSRGNAGCSFFSLITAQSPDMAGACLAMFVVNPGSRPATLRLERDGQTLALDKAARRPVGGGLDLQYVPLESNAQLPPGEVAILFLAHSDGQRFARCPGLVIPTLNVPSSMRIGLPEDAPASGIGRAFHLTSDHPVIAYQVFPYGGGSSALTSATLLLPEEAWGQGYVAVHAVQNNYNRNLAIPRNVAVVAAHDDTEVTIRPTAAVEAGGGVPAIARGALGRVRLQAGQYLEVAHRTEELTGSIVTASKPVGLFGGAPCLQVPADVCCCDSSHQQIPPIEALGSEYAGIRYRSRAADREELVPWRLVGAVDGTTLRYDPAAPAGAPTTIARGQTADFQTPQPFVVRSQDDDHPFYLGGYMTGGDAFAGAGDPEFVNVLPTSQYLASYVFFTDPTYPETNLVVIRKRGGDGAFAEVKLDCSAAPLAGWRPLGQLEYTRVDLVSGNWAPALAGCNNGRQKMSSTAPFAVTVWGWGTAATGAGNVFGSPPNFPLPPWYTRFASYAYPAGASIGRVNQVVVIP